MPGAMAHNADAELRELAGDRQHHRNDAALGGGIGGLPDLPVIGGDRGGRDDHAALAVIERIERRHRVGGEPDGVERADEVDVDHPREILERHRPVAADDAARRRDAGAVDEDARRPELVARLRDGSGGLVGVDHVAGDGDAADLRRHLRRRLDVDVEDRHLGAERRELRRGRPAEAGAAAGDERCITTGMHGKTGPVSSEPQLLSGLCIAAQASPAGGAMLVAARNLTGPELIRK